MTILEHELLLSEQLRRVPLAELQARISKFRAVMDRDFPGWEIAIVNNKVNMYYFAGTMQDGVLVIRPQDAVLWVRRSYERACNESLLEDIRPMPKLSHFGRVLSAAAAEGLSGRKNSDPGMGAAATKISTLWRKRGY